MVTLALAFLALGTGFFGQMLSKAKVDEILLSSSIDASMKERIRA